MPFEDQLPRTVRQIKLAPLSAEGPERIIYLVGTAHVSQQSVEDVEETLRIVAPVEVAVELCEARFRNLSDPESWSKLDVFQVLREGKAPLMLSNLVMNAFQRRIADQLGTEPGAEMKAAVAWADTNHARLSLIDRDVQVTLRRTWAGLGLWTKLKAVSQMIGGLFISEEIDSETIEQLKEEGQLEDMLSSMAQAFPEVKESLIDERDVWMAEKLRLTQADTVVAVVGAGHVPGMVEHIEAPSELGALAAVPPPSLVPRILKWAIPIAVIALLAWGFVTGSRDQSFESVGIWFLVNGVLSALGAALAFGHPVTVISAFFAAPLTSLNPMVAAGWVAGLVQAWVKRPLIGDLERLPEDITTVRGFWSNPLCRVLLVVVFANLGSIAGTFIAGTWIAGRVL